MPKEIDEDESCRYWQAKWAPPLFAKEGWGEISPLPLESKRATFTYHPASNPPKPPFVKGGIDVHRFPWEPRCHAGSWLHIAIDSFSCLTILMPSPSDSWVKSLCH